MRRAAFVAIAASIIGGTIVVSAPASANEAFTLKPVDGGFVRMDVATGHITTCSGTIDALVCRSAPDERIALETEIDRLTAENLRLQAAAKAGGTGLPSAKVEFTLPSEAEIDKAMTFFEKMVKRFKSIMDDLSKEPGNATPL